jgi:hypothetical protein
MISAIVAFRPTYMMLIRVLSLLVLLTRDAGRRTARAGPTWKQSSIAVPHRPLVAPAGDILERRRLVVTLMLLAP